MLIKIVRVILVGVNLSSMSLIASYAIPLIMSRDYSTDPLKDAFFAGLVAVLVALFYEICLVKE